MKNYQKRSFLLLSISLFLLLTTRSYALQFVVDNTFDTDNLAAYTAGDLTNSLRKCMRLSNATAGKDSIYFAIPAAPYLITAGAALPALTDPVFIDGLTQTGAAAGSPLIEIDGAGLNTLQLNAGASGSTIKGLILYGANRGIYLDNSSNNLIIANHIGTNQTATALPTGVIVWNGIEINGASINNIIGGIAGVTTRNIISGANEMGIRIQGAATGTQIIGNYIGTNINATAMIPNRQFGIFLLPGSHNTVIGGNTTAHRNIISGNQKGILIDNSSFCTIQNNYVGTDITGLSSLGNTGTGIELINTSRFTQILGNTVAANGQQGILATSNSHLPFIRGNNIGIGSNGTTPLGNLNHGIEIQNCYGPIIGGTALSERNHIGNNSFFGIRIDNGDSAVIKGNYIGVDQTGLVDHGNGQVGVFIIQSDIVQLGGPLIGDGNVISGNNQRGLVFDNNSNRPVIKGNKIGVSADGTTPIPNNQHGLHIINCFKPIIGGTTVNERNIISNNLQFGVRIENGDSAIVQGNYIGVDGTGLLDHGNTQIGILLLLSDNVLIGGSVTGAGNIISGNNERGLVIENNSFRPVIKGNYLGVGSNGTTPIGNSQIALHIINCFKPRIGGSLTAERNIISANMQYGVRIDNGDSVVVQGNYVGVDGTGLADLGNNQVGLYISASDDAIIGGAVSGQRNIISGNTERGLVLDNSPRPTIKGNIIGLGSDISTAIGNGQIGLHIINSTTAVIGGSTVIERNYISSNGQHGVMIASSPFSTVKGNYIGVDGTGLLNRGNVNNGILLDNCRQSIIGGSSRLERNICSGSAAGNGIEINGDSKRCILRGNFCGIGADGVTDIGNWINGINVFWTSDTLIIGGSNFMDRNVCSANGKSGTGDGIRVEGPDGHTILGNFCGVDSTGTVTRGNAWAGISLNESDDNTVGGSGQYDGNICSGNLNEGVWLRNANRNQFFGNFVGTDRTGTLQLGNQDWGFAISDQGVNSNNIIGGSLANANTIAYNLNIDPIRNGQGVYVDNNSHRNLITFNKIYCNAGLGIDRNGLGNENVASPQIITSLSMSVNGTGTPGHTVHVYRNLTTDAGSACNCEGELYVGTTNVGVDGTWTLIHNLGLTPAATSTVTATQTNTTNSTSAFSNCLPSCEFEASVQASDTLINTFAPKEIQLTSTVIPNSFNPAPVMYYWSVNTPDTTGVALISNDTMVTINLASSNIVLSENGTYQVYLIVKQGLCFDSILVELASYQIPNLVTPNGDGSNDLWKVSTSSNLYDAEIYNRWGKRIFYQTGYTNEWDVAAVSDGIYYFYLKSKNKAVPDANGWVQVMR